MKKTQKKKEGTSYEFRVFGAVMATFFILFLAVIFPALAFPTGAENVEASVSGQIAADPKQRPQFPNNDSGEETVSEKETSPVTISSVFSPGISVPPQPPETRFSRESQPPAPSPATQKIQVSLTFDDGPGPYTDVLLDALAQKNVKVTFFVLGSQAEKYPDVIKRIISEGHILSNHSYSHEDLTGANATSELIHSEIQKTDTILTNLGAPRVPFFRPPYGHKNDTVIAAANRPILMWTLDPKDWQVKNKDIVVENITRKTEDGSIILLHDIHETTVEAVPEVLEYFSEAGVEVIPLDQLLSRKGVLPQAGEVYFQG